VGGWMIKRAPRWGNWFTRYFRFGYNGFAYYREDPTSNDKALAHAQVIARPIRFLPRRDIVAWVAYPAPAWWLQTGLEALKHETTKPEAKNANSSCGAPVSIGLVAEALDLHKDEVW